ncbi:MAG: flagellar hook-associated protein FlgK [Hyphomonas sp.]|nr:flagellar hook-associated protein FlgK [Hyphomonas sp.]
MTISSAINAARTGLQATSLRADIAAANVANANTAGYVRRSVLLAESLVSGGTTGVHSAGIARSQDYALTAQRRSLTSDLAQADMMSSTWQTISSRVGNSLDGTGLFAQFSKFETTLTDLALTPESASNATAVLGAAQGIVSEFNSLSQMVFDLRAEADNEIALGVERVNSALQGIEKLNTQLTGMSRSTPEAAALMDERQRLLDQISEYIPVKAVDREYGKIDIVTPDGVFLLAGQARTVEFSPSTAFGPGVTVDNGGLSRLMVDGVDLTPGANSFGAVSSGLFGALFTLRDSDLPELGAQLDTLAGDLISRLSDDSIDPTKTPGAYGIFIDSAGTGDPGLAGRIRVNPAIDPAQGGAVWRLRDGLEATAPGLASDSSILNAMLDAVTAIRPINSNGIQGSFSSTDMVAQFSSIVGQKRLQNDYVLSSTNAQHTLLVEAERAENGVDIDSEMQDLLLIEQAYAANARVIEIAGSMIDRLMELF